METVTFTIHTPRGLAEAVVAYSLIPQTLWDRLLRRTRFKYGIGLCNQRDFRDDRYIPGRTREIAVGRHDRGSNSNLAGVDVTSYPDFMEDVPLVQLRRIALWATPRSWWQ